MRRRYPPRNGWESGREISWLFIEETNVGGVYRTYGDRHWCGSIAPIDPDSFDPPFSRRCHAKRWVECQVAKMNPEVKV